MVGCAWWYAVKHCCKSLLFVLAILMTVHLENSCLMVASPGEVRVSLQVVVLESLFI